MPESEKPSSAQNDEKALWEQSAYPILRVKRDATLEHANAAAGALLKALGVALGERLPEPLRERLLGTSLPEPLREAEVRVLDRVFCLLCVPAGPDHVHIYAYDITDKKRLEAQLLQAQKMESLGRLAGGVAHDFNNMLTAILGYTDFLKASPSLEAQSREDLLEIEKAALRASELTRRLLTFSRQQILETPTCDLNAVALDMERMLRCLTGESVRLELLLEPELGPVRADKGQVEQVILNLAVNARDAMARGGKLILETSRVLLDTESLHGHFGLKPGRYVMLAVSDTGSGMSPEIQAQIFEPFFTTKGKDNGSGLGLSIVYGIVKNGGGDLWVYSEPGRGSVFKIFFPLAEAQTPAEEPPPPGRLEGTETILVVEDEDPIRELAYRSLARRGYRVLGARRPREALRLMEENGDSVQLVLTDLVMPEMSGLELARSLLGRRPHLRVVYMSGFTDKAVGHYEPLAGQALHLARPFTPEALARKVRQALDR